MPSMADLFAGLDMLNTVTGEDGSKELDKIMSDFGDAASSSTQTGGYTSFNFSRTTESKGISNAILIGFGAVGVIGLVYLLKGRKGR